MCDSVSIKSRSDDICCKKQEDTWAMLTLQGSQTEGGDLAGAVSESEEGKEKEENMYTFHLFQFKEVSYGDKVQS